ncbi:MAG: hypothetical protein IT308_09100 [Anaerolineaceae bacterium]|nr:hypothetical protein [Anaerolineaceae bacterium]
MTWFKLIKVTGSSLEPAFSAGDFVGISRIPFLFTAPAAGDVVVFRKAPYGTLIKTIACVEPGGKELHVLGTHADSIDSRNFGPIPFETVQGKVIWHIRKKR